MYYQFTTTVDAPSISSPTNISTIKFREEVQTALGINLAVLVIKGTDFCVPKVSIVLDQGQIDAIQAIATAHTFDPATEGYTMAEKSMDVYRMLGFAV